jgi:arabinose-5-phosphate isomerase
MVNNGLIRTWFEAERAGFSCYCGRRTAKHGGWNRMAELKVKASGTTSDAPGAAVDSALRTLEAEAGGVAAISAAIRGTLGQAFSKAVETIRNSRGRVIVSGMGKSGHIGRKIAATLASTGTPSFFVHPAEASHGDLGMIAADDVILALSWSGETAELKNLIDYSRRYKIPLIAMTAFCDSTLAKAADVSLELPPAREACPHNLAPTTSSLMQLALGDALAIALLESRGFTAIDFGLLHPAGKLGAMLKRVSDVMRTGKDLPISALAARMSDAVMEMSAKGYGCVGIVDGGGRLVGIVTDGDLRRHMRPDLLQVPVAEIMTRNPKTIRPDALASEALELINSSKIQALMVVEADGKPIGILRVHDLLRVGVA